MSKKSEIIRIWQECFPQDSPQWRRMFFDAAYVDEEAMTETDPETGATVSSLLLLPYSMSFNGESLGVAYIYGAGTLKKFRAKGHMGRLLKRSLRETAERGDALAVLIPASEKLQGYYSRFGFASVFYRQPERYTAIHRFPVEGKYMDVSTRRAAELFPAFERLIGQRDYCVQHSSAQFLTAMEDTRMSGYGFAAVCREGEENPEPCAMAWGRHEDTSDDIIVTELLAEDPDAANAAIGLLQQQMPGRPVTLKLPADDEYIGGHLESEGMARVVNPEIVLGAIAAANPRLRLTIRLTDPILTENTGIYKIRDGKLSVSDSTAGEHAVDLDLTPETLTAMLFSSSPIAEITGLPARRPNMALMLN